MYVLLTTARGTKEAMMTIENRPKAAIWRALGAMVLATAGLIGTAAKQQRAAAAANNESSGDLGSVRLWQKNKEPQKLMRIV